MRRTSETVKTDGVEKHRVVVIMMCIGCKLVLYDDGNNIIIIYAWRERLIYSPFYGISF